MGLADFNDAGHFHNWGFSLPLCKSSGLSTNCVGASKPLAVRVKHRHLLVMVFPPTVFPEFRMFPDCYSEEYTTLNISNELFQLSRGWHTA